METHIHTRGYTSSVGENIDPTHRPRLGPDFGGGSRIIKSD